MPRLSCASSSWIGTRLGTWVTILCIWPSWVLAASLKLVVCIGLEVRGGFSLALYKSQGVKSQSTSVALLWPCLCESRGCIASCKVWQFVQRPLLCVGLSLPSREPCI